MKVHLMLKPENDEQRAALVLIAGGVSGGLMREQSKGGWYEYNGTVEDAHRILSALVEIRRVVYEPVRYQPQTETR